MTLDMDGFECATQEELKFRNDEIIFCNSIIKELGDPVPYIARNSRPQHFILRDEELVKLIRSRLLVYCKSNYKNIISDKLETIYHNVVRQKCTKTLNKTLYRVRCIDDNNREWIVPCFAKACPGGKNIQIFVEEKIDTDYLDELILNNSFEDAVSLLSIKYKKTKEQAKQIIIGRLEK